MGFGPCGGKGNPKHPAWIARQNRRINDFLVHAGITNPDLLKRLSVDPKHYRGSKYPLLDPAQRAAILGNLETLEFFFDPNKIYTEQIDHPLIIALRNIQDIQQAKKAGITVINKMRAENQSIVDSFALTALKVGQLDTLCEIAKSLNLVNPLHQTNEGKLNLVEQLLPDFLSGKPRGLEYIPLLFQEIERRGVPAELLTHRVVSDLAAAMGKTGGKKIQDVFRIALDLTLKSEDNTQDQLELISRKLAEGVKDSILGNAEELDYFISMLSKTWANFRNLFNIVTKVENKTKTSPVRSLAEGAKKGNKEASILLNRLIDLFVTNFDKPRSNSADKGKLIQLLNELIYSKDFSENGFVRTWDSLDIIESVFKQMQRGVIGTERIFTKLLEGYVLENEELPSSLLGNLQSITNPEPKLANLLRQMGVSVSAA